MSKIKAEETIKSHLELKKFFKNILKPDRTPVSKYEILMVLNNEEGIRIGDLSKKVDITRPNLTPLINALEKDGDVERIKDEKDNRASIVKITKKGKQTYQKSLELIEERLKEINNSFNDEELNLINKSFDSIIKTIEK